MSDGYDTSDLSLDPVVVVDRQGLTLQLNRASRARFVGLELGDPLAAHVRDPQELARLIARFASQPAPSVAALELGEAAGACAVRVRGARLRRPGGGVAVGLQFSPAGDERFAALSRQVRDLNAEIGGMRATRRELEELLASEKAAVEHGATHDALTGLMNRGLFQARLLERIQRPGDHAVLLADLNGLRKINDSLGHESGDELLTLFAGRLQTLSPEGADVARTGGDTFAVGVALAEGDDELERLRQEIALAASGLFPLRRGPVRLRATIGMARSHDAAEGVDLMRRADLALNAAKAAGRGGARLYSDDLDLASRERAELERDLRLAVTRGELWLAYQPKVDKAGTMRGVEVLVRWTHPVLGPVPPPRFIGVAEQTGLILDLGSWILREACAFARRRPDLCVAVNVSPMQLRHPRFTADVREAVALHGVDPARIELEVTETALMDDTTASSDVLAALRAAGMRVSLDDFGTGYSSLRHLHHLAVDRVKIDQSFVRNLETSRESSAIVMAVIRLGHAMGLKVTAEGVETPGQWGFLVDAGIDELQGYLFGRPTAEAALAAPPSSEADGLRPLAASGRSQAA